MINIADQYKNYLKTITYGNGYDVRIHGLQTALSVLGYIVRDNVNKNNVQYGYHGVDTENMIKDYQSDRGFVNDGIIDEKTWDYIFYDLMVKYKVTVVQTGERQVSLYDIDKLLEIENNNSNIQSGNSGVVIDPNGNDGGIDGTINAPSYDNDLSYPNNNNGFLLNDSDYSGTGFQSFGDGTDYPDIGFHTFGGVGGYTNGGSNSLNGLYDYANGGENSYSFIGAFNTNGNANFDELVYNYMVSGGEVYNGLTYNYNIEGSQSWHSDRVDYYTAGSSNKDYDYIYNLFANSVYEGALRTDPLWSSASDTNVGHYNRSFEKVTQKPFFSPGNIGKLRGSKFDITIVYGAKGENARKIVEVTPISVTQEFDASGEPIYDLYEFIAKDVVYGGSTNG